MSSIPETHEAVAAELSPGLGGARPRTKKTVGNPALSVGGAAPSVWTNFMNQMGLSAAPGWAVSLGVHLFVLMILFGIKFHTDSNSKNSAVLGSIEDDVSQQAFETAQDQVGIGADATVLTSGAQASAASAATQASSESAQSNVEQRLNEEVVGSGDSGPKISVGGTELAAISDKELMGSVNSGKDSSSRGETENTGGTEGAIDRIAYEIAASLNQKKTLVVWMFDASLSLRDRRNMIADRFENVYRQLDSLEVGADKALKTAVMTYGEKVEILTKDPVDDVRTVIPKVRAIKNDESGKEYVFTAVDVAAKAFQKYKREQGRNVMLIIVTDEKGDDANKMEDVISHCRRFGIKCFVVGNAALFGREKGYVHWKYEDGSAEDLEVDSGPETIYPESIPIAFWGNNGPDLSRMSSGYGPYALTRLCKETGGLYFIAEEGTSLKFPPEVMRNYAPDYRPIRDYDASIKKNKAKTMLVTVALKFKEDKMDSVPLPQLVFEAGTDTVLREKITEAQRPAATLDYKLNEMLGALLQGEKDREKISEPRWRAAYDLALGRILAMHVRALGYNKMLAEMKGLPKQFQKKGSNEWRLTPAKNISAGPDIKKIAAQATKYLKRVIDENSETPWASLAERELSIPMGWDWQEATGNYPGAGLDGEARKKAIRLAEEKAKQAASKTPAAPAKAKPKL